jgi:hypothetical protein
MEVLAAGVLSILLGIGHETLGVVWVLPRLTPDRLEPTPFGSSSMTVAMVHATWHIVTVFALGMGTILVLIASDSAADVKQILLRVLSVMWLGATVAAMASALPRVRGVRDLFRLPVPVLFMVVSVLCWIAAA